MPASKTTAELIDWKTSAHTEVGRVAGLRFFGIHWAMTGSGYVLTTLLPIKAPALEERYPTSAHAKVAAEKLWRAFLDRVTTTRGEQSAETNESEGSK